MTGKFERKFVVDPDGTAKKEAGPDGESKVDLGHKRKKIIGLPKEERKFTVDPEGNVKIEKKGLTP